MILDFKTPIRSPQIKSLAESAIVKSHSALEIDNTEYSSSVSPANLNKSPYMSSTEFMKIFASTNGEDYLKSLLTNDEYISQYQEIMRPKPEYSKTAYNKKIHAITPKDSMKYALHDKGLFLYLIVEKNRQKNIMY